MMHTDSASVHLCIDANCLILMCITTTQSIINGSISTDLPNPLAANIPYHIPNSTDLVDQTGQLNLAGGANSCVF